MQQADERQKQIIFSSSLIFKIQDIFFAIKMHVIFNLVNKTYPMIKIFVDFIDSNHAAHQYQTNSMLHLQLLLCDWQ